VLAAPHHGSKNGISAEAMRLIKPHTTLISAGVNNQYGHPDSEATKLFSAHAQKYFSTSYGGGQSLKTVVTGAEINTYKFVS
jgi:beta-lactamase superfamily II metal-dependent hydrolase